MCCSVVNESAASAGAGLAVLAAGLGRALSQGWVCAWGMALWRACSRAMGECAAAAARRPGSFKFADHKGQTAGGPACLQNFVYLQKCPLNKLHQAIRRSGKTGAPVKPGRHPQPKLSATALVHVGTEYGRRTGPWPGDNRAEQTSSTSKSKHTMHCGSSAAAKSGESQNRENRWPGSRLSGRSGVPMNSSQSRPPGAAGGHTAACQRTWFRGTLDFLCQVTNDLNQPSHARSGPRPHTKLRLHARAYAH